MKKRYFGMMAAVMAISLAGGNGLNVAQAEETAKETKTLQILATSDTHGKFAPYDYVLNKESTTGSLAQVATVVKELRNENTILVDAGDTIQANSANLFLDDEIHPMYLAMNEIGYDVWVTGNHEYNYGMDVLQRIIPQNNGQLITGNVYDPEGEGLAEDYAIVERDGVKVGIIGMVTPNIVRWDAVNLKDWTVTDPVEETAKVIDAIKDEVDVLIAVDHMGIENEYEVAHSGVADLANECPELDAIVSAHNHQAIAGEIINGVLIVENKDSGATLAKIDLTVEQGEDGKWHVVDRASEIIDVSEYEADAELMEKLKPYDERAREDANTVVGEVVDADLVPENEIPGIMQAQIEDSARADFINEAQLYYTGADVSATAVTYTDAVLEEGQELKKSDVTVLYKFTNNTLYKMEMTGKQLKEYMEWSASYYNTFQDGDLTISFNEDIRDYNYDIFAGVNYEINIANEPGSRIENLTWPDGTPVEDDDVFTLAVNNYRATSHLTVPGALYGEDEELPKILEIEVAGNIGGLCDILQDYIVNVKEGVVNATVDNNWKLTGYEWDEELHNKAVEMVNNGELEIKASEDGRTLNVAPITVDDVQ